MQVVAQCVFELQTAISESICSVHESMLFDNEAGKEGIIFGEKENQLG